MTIREKNVCPVCESKEAVEYDSRSGFHVMVPHRKGGCSLCSFCEGAGKPPKEIVQEKEKATISIFKDISHQGIIPV